MSAVRGVERYAHGRATVDVYFPGGQTACKWCKLFCRYEEAFKRYSCRLTEEWILDPARQIGERCPIKFDYDGEEGTR